MVDANIPDIALEPDKTVKKVSGGAGQTPQPIHYVALID